MNIIDKESKGVLLISDMHPRSFPLGKSKYLRLFGNINDGTIKTAQFKQESRNYLARRRVEVSTQALEFTIRFIAM